MTTYQVEVFLDPVDQPSMVLNIDAPDTDAAEIYADSLLRKHNIEYLFVRARVPQPLPAEWLTPGGVREPDLHNPHNSPTTQPGAKSSSELLGVLRDIAVPTTQHFVIEQISPLEYRITVDGITRGTHDLAGVLRWTLWAARAPHVAVSVRLGIETINILTNP